MKLDNLLRIVFYAATPLPVQITYNNIPKKIIVNDTVEFTIKLIARQNQNTITVERLDDISTEFLHIKNIYLGKINITQLIHHYGICNAIFKETGKKFGDFVNELGTPDLLKLSIDADFYRVMLDNPTLISFDQ